MNGALGHSKQFRFEDIQFKHTLVRAAFLTGFAVPSSPCFCQSGLRSIFSSSWVCCVSGKSGYAKEEKEEEIGRRKGLLLLLSKAKEEGGSWNGARYIEWREREKRNVFPAKNATFMSIRLNQVVPFYSKVVSHHLFSATVCFPVVYRSTMLREKKGIISSGIGDGGWGKRGSLV